MLVNEAYNERVSLSEHAHYATPGIGFDWSIAKGHPFAYHVYGTAVVGVSVDCLRGIYTVDYVKCCHDFGSSMNTAIDYGQIEGGIVQGLGWMTMEEVVYDAEGRLSLRVVGVTEVSTDPSNPLSRSYELTEDFLAYDSLGQLLTLRRQKAHVGAGAVLYVEEDTVTNNYNIRGRVEESVDVRRSFTVTGGAPSAAKTTTTVTRVGASGFDDAGRMRDFIAVTFDGARYDCGSKVGFVEATLAIALSRPDMGDAVRAIAERLLK